MKCGIKNLFQDDDSDIEDIEVTKTTPELVQERTSLVQEQERTNLVKEQEAKESQEHTTLVKEPTNLVNKTGSLSKDNISLAKDNTSLVGDTAEQMGEVESPFGFVVDESAHSASPHKPFKMRECPVCKVIIYNAVMIQIRWRYEASTNLYVRQCFLPTTSSNFTFRSKSQICPTLNFYNPIE